MTAEDKLKELRGYIEKRRNQAKQEQMECDAEFKSLYKIEFETFCEVLGKMETLKA